MHAGSEQSRAQAEHKQIDTSHTTHSALTHTDSTHANDLYAPINHHIANSSRTELASLTIATLIPGPAHMATDSKAVFQQRLVALGLDKLKKKVAENKWDTLGKSHATELMTTGGFGQRWNLGTLFEQLH